MKVLILTILLAVFSIDVFSQNEGPPPPLIYSAPDKSQIAEFRADRLGFKIDFPGKPAETSKLSNEENVFIFKLYINGSNKIVKVTELGFDKLQNINAAEIFEQKKLEYLRAENNTLEYEKDISFKNFKGKEFAVKRGYEFQKSRVYIAGNKIYEITIDVTNWHILQNHYKPKVAEFEAEAAGFFDSFEIIRVTIIGDTTVIPDKINASKEIIQTKPAADSFNLQTRIFESKDGGFKAYFPTKPEKTVTQLKNSYGASDFVIYMSETPASVYGVSYFDMPTVITQDYEKTLNYHSQRDALINGTGGKLLSENVFEFKEINGREFVIFGNNSVATMRTFFVNQRMFRNLVIFPVADEKSALLKVKESQDLIKKFFESFAVTELPAPKATVVELPEDFAIKIENDTFYSGFFNFSIKIPKGFRFFEKEETDNAKKLGLEMSENLTTLNKDFLNLSYNRTALLMIAEKTAENAGDSSQILTIAAESLSSPIFSAKVMADSHLKILIEEKESISKTTQEELIGGEQFAWVEMHLKKTNSKHRVYFANIKGIAFQISYIYKTEEELNDFLKSLKTINFENQKSR